MATRTERPRQSDKSADQRVAFAVGHWIRVAILTILNEGTYCADDLAEFIGETRQTVHHHLSELRDAGSIEIARSEKKRNADHHFYRAVEPARFSKEQLDELAPEERNAIAAIIIQLSMAEVIEALKVGTLADDPRVCLMWRWFNLDEEGRDQLFEEQESYWERVQAIEADATNRRAISEEEPKSYLVSQWGFQRARTAPVPKNAD